MLHSRSRDYGLSLYEDYNYINTQYSSVDGAVWQYACLISQVGEGIGTRYGNASYFYYIPANIKNVTITRQKDIPVAAFNSCDFIETITLSVNVETIGDYAFQNCNATIRYA